MKYKVFLFHNHITIRGLKISQDSTSKKNIFYNNQITHYTVGVDTTADPNTEVPHIKHKIHN